MTGLHAADTPGNTGGLALDVTALVAGGGWWRTVLGDGC